MALAAGLLAAAAIMFFPAAALVGSADQCGAYALRAGSGNGRETLSLVTSGDRIAYRVRAARIGEWRCMDLSGDGIPELLFASYSGGSRCCTTQHVVSLTKPPRLLLLWEAGSATDLKPLRASGNPARAMLGGEDDRLINFGGLPSAYSPLLPVSFCLEGGRYSDCSKESTTREALRESLAAESARLAAETNAMRRKSVALRMLALALRAGEADLALGPVRQLAPEAEAWLLANLESLERCVKIAATAPRARRLHACGP